VFLRKIVKGKGLLEIIEATQAEPLPTPMVMLDFAALLARTRPAWRDFCLVDIGGATTDFYSNCETAPEAGVILKGLKEPGLKRTVEGDLGVRVSAAAAVQAAGPYWDRELMARKIKRAALAKYLDKITVRTDFLPSAQTEKEFDYLLAAGCLHYAAIRHAGWRQSVYTPAGKVTVQTGKDLSSVRKVIGSGGFLAGHPELNAAAIIGAAGAADAEKTILVPGSAAYYVDRRHLFPLLANLARKYPGPATGLGLKSLEKAA
jgi:uncharacterized protein (TIGR01319 family)